MKWLWTFLAYLASLAITCTVCFVIVIFFAGPHSDLLPRFLQTPLVVVAGLTVLLLPTYIARRVYLRLGK